MSTYCTSIELDLMGLDCPFKAEVEFAYHPAIPGNAETPEQLQDMFADELADAFIYLDLTAQAAGIDLPSAIRQKFDRTSQKIGYRS